MIPVTPDASPSRALVTGATGAIGLALARALALQGCRVVLAGREPGRLRAAADTLPGGLGDILPVDLARRESVAAAAETLTARDFDVVVHAAGLLIPGGAETLALDDLDRMLEVNARAPFVLTRALLPGLRRRKGQVVFLNSSAILRPSPAVTGYAAAKAALKVMADTLRDELNADGVRVLSVFPGRTASAMQAEVHRREGKAYQPEKLLQPADIAAAVLNALLLPRTAELTDLHIRPMAKG